MDRVQTPSQALTQSSMIITRVPHLHLQHTASAADRGGGGGGGNKGSLPWAPSVKGPPNSAELVQILAVSDRKVRRTGPQLYSSGLHSNKMCIEVHVRAA